MTEGRLVRATALVRNGFRIFSGRGARFLGAAVAFYALLSAAPLFVVVLHLVAAVFGRERAASALWSGLSRWAAPDGVETMRRLTDRLDEREGSSGIVGALLVVYGSTRLFGALRRAVNHLWGIDLEAVEGARPAAVKYGLRYGGALLLATFIAVLVAAIVAEKSAFLFLASHGAPLPDRIVWILDMGTSGLLTFALFTALFWFLPETRVTIRQATVSAAVSTTLFAIGSSAVTMYIRHKRVGDLYDGAGAIVVVVLWVYYSAQVFFLGASFGAALRSPVRA